jgi:hypothetical protein
MEIKYLDILHKKKFAWTMCKKYGKFSPFKKKILAIEIFK